MIDQKLKKITTNKQLKKYLDQFNEVEGSWDGGNDSGSWQIRADGEEINNYESYLDTLINNELNYGSWAGNFNSTGTITYDKTTGIIKFEGDEYDSENKELLRCIDITLKIPKEVSTTMDSISIEMSNDNNISVYINVETGAILPIHQKLADKLEEYLVKKTENECNSDDGEEFYFSDTFEPSDIIDNELVITLNIEKERHVGINYEIDLNEN